MRRAAVASAIAFATILTGSRSHAQSAQSTAEVLFDEGRRLMGEKRWSEACPKLAESRRLDPGIGVSLYLGECWAQAGQYASAWGAFREAASLAHGTKDAREKVANDRIAEMEKHLYKISLVVSPQARVSGLAVQRDGVALSEAMWGVEFPVDPGDHTFTASAPGKTAWTKTVTVPKDQGRLTLEVPPFEDEKPATPVPTTPAPQPTPPPPEEPKHDGSALRTVGLGLAVGGVIGIGVGTIFGLNALSKRNDIDAHCSGSVCDSQTAVDKRQSARSDATISTVGFIAGGVLLAGGAVLFFTAPSGKSSSPKGGRTYPVRVVPGFASLAIDGTF